MRRASWIALVLAAIVVAACAARLARGSGPAGTAAPVIARVVDGDTVDVRIGGRRQRVRLHGIDTPESVRPDTPVQCFALEASARTKTLLPKGTAVRLVGDIERRDRYGRLLAYVFRDADGLFINLELAREGFAVPYTYAPNVAHASEIVAAAADARAAGRGLWSRCGPDDIPRHPARGP